MGQVKGDSPRVEPGISVVSQLFHLHGDIIYEHHLTNLNCLLLHSKIYSNCAMTIL